MQDMSIRDRLIESARNVARWGGFFAWVFYLTGAIATAGGIVAGMQTQNPIAWVAAIAGVPAFAFGLFVASIAEAASVYMLAKAETLHA